MKLIEFGIRHFRSIENANIKLPNNKPLIIFGPNNAGKTNILTAINIALGESFPTYHEMEESDYFMRNKDNFFQIDFICKFDENYYTDRYGRSEKEIIISYNYQTENGKENLFRNKSGDKLCVNKEQRQKCQSIYLDAVRNIGVSLSYSSKYTLLSKFSSQIHKSLKEEKKLELNNLFQKIKDLFNSSPEFNNFFEKFKTSVENTVKGFVHTLEVDFSGYDPNNYTKSLRIVGKEGDFVGSFEELGTGEQQTLLMAFVKAYMETFSNENFILIIEEPEAHLHPIAQRWLKKYINDICEHGIQVVISTHSPEFIDATNLEGLVKVYKENNITKVRQISSDELCQYCVNNGANPEKTTVDNILKFYSACLYSDQLKGLFAQKIIFVEGDTECLTLPIYFERCGLNLEAEGIEIVKCQGKNNILKYFRFFKNYGYKCFCLFDADENRGNNDEFINIFNILTLNKNAVDFNVGEEYACFGVDFEEYMRHKISDYSSLELDAKNFLSTNSKPIIAKYIAENNEIVPEFIKEIIPKINNL